MSKHPFRSILPALLVTTLSLCCANGRSQTPIAIADVDRDTQVSFERDVLPIFRKNCLACHSASEAYGELVLETPDAILKGGDAGPAVLPGKGHESLLLKLAAHLVEPVMPPEDNDVAAEPLTPQQLGLIKLWIDQGARGSSAGVSASPRHWRSLPPGTHPIYAVTVTTDGQFVACGRANQILIYHVPTGELVTRLTDPQLQSEAAEPQPGIAHLDVVQALAFNDSGDMLASGGYRTVKLWRRPKDVQRLTISSPGGAATAMAVSVDGGLLATAAADNSIRLWDLANGQLSAELVGHTAEVTGLRFSHDGGHLYSGSEDKTIRVWRLADGKLAGRIDTPTAISAITTLALLGPNAAAKGPAADGNSPPNGQVDVVEQIVSGGGDNVIRVWDLPLDVPEAASTGSAESTDSSEQSPYEVRSISGHSGPVTSLVTMPTESPELLSGSEDGTIRRWNAASGQLIRQMNHGGPVTGVDVSPDGKRVASVSSNKTAKLWNAATGQQLSEMRGDDRAKALVARLTQEKAMSAAKVAAAKSAVGAAEKALPARKDAQQKAAEALAAAKKEAEAKSAAHRSAMAKKAAAEAEAIQAAAAAQKAANELERLKQLARAAAEKATSLNDAAQRAQAVAAGDPEDAALAETAKASADAARSAEEESKAAEAAVAAPAQTAAQTAKAATDAATKAVAAGKPFTEATKALAQAEAAQASALQADQVATRDLEQATAAIPEAKEVLNQAEAMLQKTEADLAAAKKAETEAQLPLLSVAFSPDGRTVATGGQLGVVHTWDSETGDAVSSYRGHSASIRTLTFVNGQELTSASDDATIAVWDVHPEWQLERVIGELSDPEVLADRVVALDFSRDGQLLASGGGVPSRNGELKLWKVTDGSLHRNIENAHTDTVNAVAFSADGTFVASASSDRYVKAFRVDTGEQTAQFEGHTDHALGVAWRAGGRVLTSCGADGTIRTWNAETGDRIRSITGYNKQVTAVRFVGQTQYVVSSSGDRIIRMHNTDNGGTQRTFSGAADYMYCIAVTPDPNGGVVVAGGHDGVLRIWRTGNAQTLHTIGPPEDQVGNES